MAKKEVESPMLVVASKVKESVKTFGEFRMSGEVPETLSKIVHAKLKAATVRAEANGRKTIKPEDL